MLTHRQPPAVPSRLVTLGAVGFVARAIGAWIELQGWPLSAVGSKDIDLTAPSAVEALAALFRPDDVVVMVAALTPDRGRDVGTMMRNLAMAQHVCAAIERQPCAHLITIGSDAVYDDAGSLIRESSPLGLGSFHGVMHLTREQMFIDTCRRLSLPLARLRPSLLYGPGDTHNGYGPNRFVRSAVAERRIALFGDGEEQRDHVFIDDVARVVAEVAQRRSAGLLNVVSGRSHSFREVAESVAALVPGTRIEPSARATPITHRHFDVSALNAAFPRFRPTGLEDGLARTVAVA